MNIESIEFAKEELNRYSRHIMIPEFGFEGQAKLKAARVLVIGSGGLGSPLLLYLAAAGVGTIGIVDFDVVEDSNLQRQVLFSTDDIGKSKVQMAKRKLQALNPYITVHVYETAINAANALDMISSYDVVADGTDNFNTRYLVNDACVLMGKPNVYASVFQFEGQVSVFNYKDCNGDVGPNYRDLYASAPPAQMIPNCGAAGVLGVVPGIIGCLQALEVIKIITGVGEVLSGRLCVFDALSFETRILHIIKDPTNPLSGDTPTIHTLKETEDHCGVGKESNIKEMTFDEFLSCQEQGEQMQLIDVREPAEYEELNLGGLLIPLADIANNQHLIARDKRVVIHCKMGGRSAQAIRLLEKNFGFNNLYNLKDGIVTHAHRMKSHCLACKD